MVSQSRNGQPEGVCVCVCVCLALLQTQAGTGPAFSEGRVSAASYAGYYYFSTVEQIMCCNPTGGQALAALDRLV